MAKPTANASDSPRASEQSSGSQEHVKRPMNAFMVWAKTERRRLAMRLPGMPNSEVSKILGDLWKQLPESEKSKFRSESESIRKQHRSDHPDYHYHPRRRVSKTTDRQGKGGSKTKSQKAKELRHSLTNAMSLYSQNPTSVQHCMARQISDGYFGYPMAQHHTLATTTGAGATFSQIVVGQGQPVMSVSCRPPNISVDSRFTQPRQCDVTAPAVSVASSGRCGWPSNLGDNAGDEWSSRPGALGAQVWPTTDPDAAMRREDVGTPPALLHSVIGESPHSNGCSSLCSPVSPLRRDASPGSSTVDSAVSPYQPAQANARAHIGSVVPSGEDDLAGYMQLYLGNSQKDTVPTDDCKLGSLLPPSEQPPPPVRSVSPPFSVPNERTLPNREHPSLAAVTTGSGGAYNFNTLSLTSRYSSCERTHPASVLSGPACAPAYSGPPLSWDQPAASESCQTMANAGGLRLPFQQQHTTGQQQPCMFPRPIGSRLVPSFQQHVAV